MDPQDVLGTIDPQLWEEACAFSEDMSAHAGRVLGELHQRTGLRLGGSADYRILYFLVRHNKPRQVIETGVAAGYSTRAILAALRQNGGGQLHSSDLPYARLDKANEIVGCLVEDELRDSSWTLSMDGDRKALPRIVRALPPQSVKLVHYDSDKSEAGRTFAMSTLAPVLAADAVIIVDDVNDNLWFREYVAATQRPWKVFTYIEDWPKFVGVVGI